MGSTTSLKEGRQSLRLKPLVPGVWDGGSGGPTVDLDHSGYPVRVKNGEVRLMIDYDTGIWYAKTN